MSDAVTNIYRYVRPKELRRSPTMSAADMAKDARALGVDVDVFTVGDLFPKPLEEEVKGWVAALHQESKQPENKSNPIYALRAEGKWRAYSETAGIGCLRAAIAEYFTRDTGIEAKADEVIIGNGGKGALSGAFYYLIDKPDATVLLAAPGWPTNYDLFPAGANLLEVDTDGRGLFTAELLKASLQALDKEPDVIFINAPSNPTGANYSAKEREAIMQVVAEETKHTLLATDDPYGKLVFDREPYAINQVLQRGAIEKKLYTAGRLAVFRTASKEYGMADSRVGWVLTKEATLRQSLQSYNESIGGGMSARNQLEAQAALMFGDGFIEKTQAALNIKRKMLMDGVDQLRFATMDAPMATIYGWVNFEGLKGIEVPASATPDQQGFTLNTPEDLMRYLVFVAGVCVVSGTAFYAPGADAANRDWHVRMSFCCEQEVLARGIQKLQQAEKLLDKAKAA